MVLVVISSFPSKASHFYTFPVWTFQLDLVHEKDPRLCILWTHKITALLLFGITCGWD